jgi:ParB-like chromosome segregation protein Spo0J
MSQSSRALATRDATRDATRAATSLPASLLDTTPGGAFSPAQADALLAALPSVQPEVDQIVRLMLSWREMPVGLGGHGRFHQSVLAVKPSRIWVNSDLYVFGEHQEDEPDEDTLRAMIASFESRQIIGEAGTVEQHTWAPLLLVNRPNPDYPDQDLMLIRGLDTLRVARAVRWPSVEAIVYPDMEDEALRSIGLHLAFRESRPPVWEALRHVFPLLEAAASFARRRGRPRAGEEHVTDDALAGLIGCDRSYIARMRRVWLSPNLRRLVTRQQLSLRVALRSVDILGRHPDLQEEVVAYIAEQGLDFEQAEAYMRQQASQARGVPTTTPRPTRRQLPAPVSPDVEGAQQGWSAPTGPGRYGAPSSAVLAAQATPGRPTPVATAPRPVSSRVAPAAALLTERAHGLWSAVEGFAAACGQDARLGRPARILSLLEETLTEIDSFLQESRQ